MDYSKFEDANILRVTVEFSGGGDEGGVDVITALFATGVEASLTPEHAREVYDECEEAVYAEYGGFAGEFYVEGTIEIDVQNRRALMKKNERVDSFEYSEQEALMQKGDRIKVVSAPEDEPELWGMKGKVISVSIAETEVRVFLDGDAYPTTLGILDVEKITDV